MILSTEYTKKPLIKQEMLLHIDICPNINPTIMPDFAELKYT